MIGIQKIKEVLSKKHIDVGILFSSKKIAFIGMSHKDKSFCVLYDSKTKLDISTSRKLYHNPVLNSDYKNLLEHLSITLDVVSYNNDKIFICIDNKVYSVSENSSSEKDVTISFVDKIISDEEYSEENIDTVETTTIQNIKRGDIVPCYKWSEFIKMDEKTLENRIEEDYLSIKDRMEGRIKDLFDKNVENHKKFLENMISIYENRDKLGDRNLELIYNKLIQWQNIMSVYKHI